MPAFALFFPVPIAIAATALIHLANNLFKVYLVGRYADWGVVIRFAIPGAVAALVGAALLNFFSDLTPLTFLFLIRRGSPGNNSECSYGSPDHCVFFF